MDWGTSLITKGKAGKSGVTQVTKGFVLPVSLVLVLTVFRKLFSRIVSQTKYFSVISSEDKYFSKIINQNRYLGRIT